MKLLKRIVIAIVGGTVLLLGIAMIPLPGPSTLLILAGLAILAVEFAWARHWLHKVRQYLPGKKSKKPKPETPSLGEPEKEPQRLTSSEK